MRDLGDSETFKGVNEKEVTESIIDNSVMQPMTFEELNITHKFLCTIRPLSEDLEARLVNALSFIQKNTNQLKD
jgi:hypothetical protein